MKEKENWVLSALKYFQWLKSIDEDNLKRVEAQLKERERLGKERKLDEEPVPEGYIDIGKQLEEQRELIKERLKDYEKTIEDISKISFLV